MQLGLVLTLTTVYALFEHQTEVINYNPKEIAINDSDSEIYFNSDVIIIERKVVKEKQTPKPKKKLVEEIIISDNPEDKETELPFPIDPIKEKVTLDDLVDYGDEDEPLDDDPRLLITVQEVPIYPGCEKGDRAAKKTCFEKKIARFINRKFNTELGQQLGLAAGTKKIFIQFMITKSGEIEIIGAKAAHARLEKEGKRVVNLLPKMIPGKENGAPVNVQYMIPIAFSIQ